MIESRMKLSLFINKDTERIIKAKQFDATSRYLDVTLLKDDGTAYDLTGCRVQFNALKADGNYIMNNAVITDAPKGEFYVELTDQTLALGDSMVKCDISVFSLDGSSILTTRSFMIQVQATVRNDEAAESTNEYNAVVTLFQDVWDMRETVRMINERFGLLTDDLEEGDLQAGSSALGALNNIWNYLKTQSTAGIVETVGSIKSVLGNPNPVSSNTQSVMNYLKFFETRGIIKYIQRGVVTLPEDSTPYTVSINQPINPQRTIVLLSGTSNTRSDYQTANAYLPYLYSLNSTSFQIKGHTASALPISYQLVEFY